MSWVSTCVPVRKGPELALREIDPVAVGMGPLDRVHRGGKLGLVGEPRG